MVACEFVSEPAFMINTSIKRMKLRGEPNMKCIKRIPDTI